MSSTQQQTIVADAIYVRGARVHNLQNVDMAIPRDRLVVMTGVSGSGKSSLAFDTLFAEGQRQYIESLSVHARQFFHQLERPDVDLVEGLQPTLSIDQRRDSQNPRSTVATATEIYDYLRLLFARVGLPECFRCGAPIRQQAPEEIVDVLMRLPEGTRLMLLAPMVRGRRGRHQDVLEAIRKAGFVRVRLDGQVFDIDAVPELSPRKMHDLDAVVDRIVVRESIRPRLAESVHLAVKNGEGTLLALYQSPAPAAAGNGAGEAASAPATRKRRTSADSAAATEGPTAAWHEEVFSTLYACPNCRTSFAELEPRTFSFNSPYGACPACEGLGYRVQFDPELVLDPTQSLAGGAIVPWSAAQDAAVRRLERQALALADKLGMDRKLPLEQLRPKQREQLWHGDGKQPGGLLVLLEKQYATATKPDALLRLEAFRGEVRCGDCGGSRLRPEARSVRIGGRAIHEVTRLTVRAAEEFLAQLDWTEDHAPIAEPLVREICSRLRFLDKVGVEYLSLDRAADTLSGGEHQRVRLATSIGSGLVGVCYVLDEPSIGLHPRDNQRLIEALRDLQQQGNTVLVVEHDAATMLAADELIDVGPGAGRHGGRIVAQGTPEAVSRDENSLTGRYLSGRESIPIPPRRRRIAKTRSITLDGVTTNNLNGVSAVFPLGALTCVTGVSGSGKSSLVNETLSRALARRLGQTASKPGPHTSLRGVAQVDKIIEIDQMPIGRTPRSNPATYSGVFDEIRRVMAGTREAKRRGYTASRFSFNVKGGRCEDCLGQGQQKIEMNFLPDLYVPCNTCGGARFNRQTLQVRYRDRSIADILSMDVDEAAAFFENFAAIHRLLVNFQDVGLGYMSLGQPSTTLSGGEAQRVKLATELSRAANGHTVYVLDEPTTGLHFDDVRRLLVVLNRLVDHGNTVIVIEHNLDVIKSADWIIDLGPEGGEAGGQIVATGTPEDVAALKGNHTGKFLRGVLGAGAAESNS